MTDEEIVARGLMRAKLDGAVVCAVERWEGSRGRVEHAPVMVIDYDALAASVLAALREAGRLVPEGCVVIDASRWERVCRER